MLNCLWELISAYWWIKPFLLNIKARKTESSLQRLRQGAQRRVGANTDTSDNIISDTDKICMQLFLDIQVWYLSFNFMLIRDILYITDIRFILGCKFCIKWFFLRESLPFGFIKDPTSAYGWLIQPYHFLWKTTLACNLNVSMLAIQYIFFCKDQWVLVIWSNMIPVYDGCTAPHLTFLFFFWFFLLCRNMHGIFVQ